MSLDDALLDEDAIPGGLLIDILYDLTLTKDGGITVAAANQEMQGRMLNAIGLLHLLQDERFNTMCSEMHYVVSQTNYLDDVSAEPTYVEEPQSAEQTQVLQKFKTIH